MTGHGGTEEGLSLALGLGVGFQEGFLLEETRVLGMSNPLGTLGKKAFQAEGVRERRPGGGKGCVLWARGVGSRGQGRPPDGKRGRQQQDTGLTPHAS